MSQINVSFKVAGGDLSSYIDQIQKKSDRLTNQAIKNAIEQNDKAKDNLRLIDEQIRAVERKQRVEMQAARSLELEKRDTALAANRDFYDQKKNEVFGDRSLSDDQMKEKITSLDVLEKSKEESIKNSYKENLQGIREQERQAKLQTSLAKENIDTIKDTARKNIAAIQAGDMKLVDVINNASTEEEKLIARLTKEGYSKEVQKETFPAGKRDSVFGGMLQLENFNKALDYGSRLMQSKDGFDMIASTFSAVGGAAATIAKGTPVEGVMAFFSKIMDTGGEFLERKGNASQEYLSEAYRYRAITGLNLDTSFDTRESGIGITSYVRKRQELAKRLGYSTNSNETTRDAIYAEKGFGVEQGTSAALVEMQRSSRENNRDLANLIGAVIEKGQGNIFKNGDHTFLNEFLGKFTNLQKELLKSQSFVPTGTTMDILGRFNRLGGEFDVRDPRAMGNISAIQNGLANPSSDNMKAMAYRILSQQNPNMGMFDLNEEMSKGLGSPGYLKGVLEMIDQIGGSDQTKMMNLSGAFKGLSLSAVRRLFDNRKSLMSGDISIEELQSQFSTDFQGTAERNTTEKEKGAARIETGLLTGSEGAIKALVEGVSRSIKESLSGAEIQIFSNNGEPGVIKINPLRSNKVRIPK